MLTHVSLHLSHATATLAMARAFPLNEIHKLTNHHPSYVIPSITFVSGKRARSMSLRKCTYGSHSSTHALLHLGCNIAKTLAMTRVAHFNTCFCTMLHFFYLLISRCPRSGAASRCYCYFIYDTNDVNISALYQPVPCPSPSFLDECQRFHVLGLGQILQTFAKILSVHSRSIRVVGVAASPLLLRCAHLFAGWPRT